MRFDALSNAALCPGVLNRGSDYLPPEEKDRLPSVFVRAIPMQELHVVILLRAIVIALQRFR